MSLTFRSLVERHGVPDLVVPNTPRVLKSAAGYLAVYTDPELPSIDDIQADLYRRIPCGDAAFLLVSGFIELDIADFTAAAARLAQRDEPIVEIIFGMSRNGRRPGRVRLTRRSDVRFASSDALRDAIARRQMLHMDEWSSMGDREVRWRLAEPSDLERGKGDCVPFLFSFSNAPSLHDEEVPISDDWEKAADFFEAHSDLYRREP